MPRAARALSQPTVNSQQSAATPRPHDPCAPAAARHSHGELQADPLTAAAAVVALVVLTWGWGAGRELSMHWHKCLPAHRSNPPYPAQPASSLHDLPPPVAAACQHVNMKKILIFFTAYWILAAITFACCWQRTGVQWGKAAVWCADKDGKKVGRKQICIAVIKCIL